MDHEPVPERAPEPAFVLVRPQMGENIGAAARAMLNFGLTRMRLVAPRDGWPAPPARRDQVGKVRRLQARELRREHPGDMQDVVGVDEEHPGLYRTS